MQLFRINSGLSVLIHTEEVFGDIMKLDWLRLIKRDRMLKRDSICIIEGGSFGTKTSENPSVSSISSFHFDQSNSGAFLSDSPGTGPKKNRDFRSPPSKMTQN
eukprot:UN06821